MNSNQPAQTDLIAVREPWKKPSLTRLRCGSAENVPGDVSNDTSLEAIGS